MLEFYIDFPDSIAPYFIIFRAVFHESFVNLNSLVLKEVGKYHFDTDDYNHCRNKKLPEHPKA